MDYQDFLANKHDRVDVSGFEIDPSEINPMLFKFQRDIVRWALRLGKAALFEECGLGKTFQQLEWARLVNKHTGRQVIILAPLAVAHQTISEGRKLDIPVVYCKDQLQVGNHPIVITNYDRLHLFDMNHFGGVVLDESSILKAFTGKTKQLIISECRNIPYKLACTATPAPNDYMELGNHADFLDIMPSNEMLMRWFINDTMNFGSYRLKKHGEKDFWRWLTSWAVCISEPKDLGAEYDMPAFKLPPLHIIQHEVEVSQSTIDRSWAEGRLIPDSNPSSTKLHKVKRENLTLRLAKTKALVDSLPADEPIIIWCDTDYEADPLSLMFPDAVEVRGSQKSERKEELLTAFGNQEVRMLVTKPEIAGYGLNYQHCAHMVFVGVSYSFEKTYQALRRSWRFGQGREVYAHMIFSLTEGDVVTTLNQKSKAFEEMQAKMNEAMQEHGLFREDDRKILTPAQSNLTVGKNWQLYLGDCVTESEKLADNSIHFGIHSPPFTSLYIYSNNEADMGNCATDDEFFKHYSYLIKQLLRTAMPGRLHSVHCKDLPEYMGRDGAAGLHDFPGDIIRAFEAARLDGDDVTKWQFHSRVTIWKDPVIEMQRTKNHGLLHKNFASTAEACRQGMADYILTFRKWPIEDGVNVIQHREPGDYVGTNPPEYSEYRVKGDRSEQANYSISVWQRYASPVWFDIDMTNVLNYQIAKSNEDEKHIAPIQLDVVRRCIDLWSMKGETVLDPFNGVGSTGYEALLSGRKYIGIELKKEYHALACKYLEEAASSMSQPSLFDLLPESGD